jgi:lipopolysaccharide-binding protein
MRKILLVLLVLVSVHVWEVSCGNTGAGFQTAFTENGLKYIAQVTQPLLEKELRNLKIPDQSGGGFSVSDIQVKSFTLPAIVPSTSVSKGVVITSSGLAVSISAHWRYKKLFLSLSGSVDMDSSGITLSVSSFVRKGAHGQFVLTSSGCVFNIGSLSVRFHGGASWLLNLFKGQIAHKIKSVLNDKACSGIRAAIDKQADMIVERLPVVAVVSPTAAINYSLVDNPTFTDSYLETRHKGEFISRVHPTEAPFSPSPLPPVSASTRMMYLWLSDYMASTASYVYTQAGVFRYTISPETVKLPKELPCLNTKCLQSVLPELFKKFPNMEVVLETDVVKPPAAAVNPDGIHGYIPGQLEVYVRANSSSAKVYAFTLHVTTHTLVSANVTEAEDRTKITFTAKFIKSDVSVVDSAIGDIEINLLQKVVDVMSQVGVNMLNEKGKIGFPLPTIEGTSLTNPSIEYGQGFVMISTDFKYSPHYLARMYAMSM